MHIAQLLVYRMNFNYRSFRHFIYEIIGIFDCWFEQMMNKNINHSNFVSQKSGYWKWCKFVFDVDIVVRIYRCGCDECVISRLDDSLRHSRSRINVYRALASPSLIALSSKDPILTAFEVSSDISGMFRFDCLLFSFNAAFVGIATLELFRA